MDADAVRKHVWAALFLFLFCLLSLWGYFFYIFYRLVASGRDAVTAERGKQKGGRQSSFLPVK